MTDQVVSPDNTQPGPSTAPPAPAVPPESTPSTTDWEAKYKGMVNVLATKDKSLDELKGQIGTLTGSQTELQGKLAAVQATADAAKVNYEQQLAELREKNTEAEGSLEVAAAYRVKMEALKSHPDLIGLADTIPNITDEETMKSYLETLARQVEEIAEAKAQRKTAGLTPGPTTPTQGAYPYDSYEAWGEALKKAAGTEEFAKMDSAFGTWALAQGQAKQVPAQKVHQL